MPRYINGQPANTPEEKAEEPKTAGQTAHKSNYVESLGGKHIVIDKNGEAKETGKKSGWF